MSLELIIVHGLKKLPGGSVPAEVVPNPLGFPDQLNYLLALAANLVFPLFIISGFLTRLACLPVLAVTLTGYFIVHGHDSLLERDTPFIYSMVFLLIAFIGPGKFSVDGFIIRSKKKVSATTKNDH